MTTQYLTVDAIAARVMKDTPGTSREDAFVIAHSEYSAKMKDMRERVLAHFRANPHLLATMRTQQQQQQQRARQQQIVRQIDIPASLACERDVLMKGGMSLGDAVIQASKNVERAVAAFQRESEKLAGAANAEEQAQNKATKKAMKKAKKAALLGIDQEAEARRKADKDASNALVNEYKKQEAAAGVKASDKPVDAPIVTPLPIVTTTPKTDLVTLANEKIAAGMNREEAFIAAHVEISAASDTEVYPSRSSIRRQMQMQKVGS